MSSYDGLAVSDAFPVAWNKNVTVLADIPRAAISLLANKLASSWQPLILKIEANTEVKKKTCSSLNIHFQLAPKIPIDLHVKIPKFTTEINVYSVEGFWSREPDFHFMITVHGVDFYATHQLKLYK